jgi:hypothetical protein
VASAPSCCDACFCNSPASPRSPQPLTCRASSKDEADAWVDALLAPLQELTLPVGMGAKSAAAAGGKAGPAMGVRSGAGEEADDDE